MPLNPEALYVQLGRLVEVMPDLWVNPIPSETQTWLGRAAALVSELNDPSEMVLLKVAVASLNTVSTRPNNVQTIISIVHRSLARAEINAPVAAQGAFISAGDTFDAFAAIGKLLSTANVSLLLVDPYMDEKALTDFAPLAPEGVSIRLLADAQGRKATLAPASERWQHQYGAKRPLEVRLALARSLHDRLIVIDETDAWTLTQSLNAFADRSPATIIKAHPEMAAMKIAAYRDLWDAAKPL